MLFVVYRRTSSLYISSRLLDPVNDIFLNYKVLIKIKISLINVKIDNDLKNVLDLVDMSI